MKVEEELMPDEMDSVSQSPYKVSHRKEDDSKAYSTFTTNDETNTLHSPHRRQKNDSRSY